MGKINSIQVLRAVAVMLVVAGHSFPRFVVGPFGVDIFFVVSGFIIATIAPGQSPGAFLFRRFWRIYPIYWLLSIPLLLAADIEFARLAASLTLWPFWAGELQQPYLVVAWTLYCEIMFYAAAALAMINWRLPLILFAGAIFTHAITGFPLAGFLGTPMVLEFLAGVMLARASRQPHLALIGLFAAVGVLALAPHHTLVDLKVLQGSGGFVRVAYWGLPAVLIVYGAVTFDAIVSRLNGASSWVTRPIPFTSCSDRSPNGFPRSTDCSAS